jgi:hypothetical protein
VPDSYRVSSRLPALAEGAAYSTGDTDTQGYDVIGDVHGCAETLKHLLLDLGYRHTDQGFRHPSRKTLFVGDIVDRGPRVREALHLVRDMCDSGQAQAVLGNHEFYAVAYFTRIAATTGEPERWLRSHSHHHNRLIAETLAQFEVYPDEWQSFLAWFKTLPLIIETPHCRVVHACWDVALIERFLAICPTAVPDDAFWQASADPRSLAAQVFNRLLCGTSMALPPGRAIDGRDGISRKHFRTRFWARSPETYADVVFQPDPLPEDLLAKRLSLDEKTQLVYYGDSEKPVFVGHYWLQGEPAPLKPNLACLDYSAVKFGKLAAYRFDGEPVLDARKFCWVQVDRGPIE